MVVYDVLDSRQSRSIVAPSRTPLQRLVFKVRGSIRSFGERDDQSRDYELRVMNTAGNMQPAATFRQFMSAVLIDIVAVYDAMAVEAREEEFVPRRPNWTVKDSRWNKNWEEFREDGDLMTLLDAHGVPGPLQNLMMHMDWWALRKFLKARARRRCEAMWLKLVVSKLPKLAGVSYLFDDFCPKPLVPTFGLVLKDIQLCYRNFAECMDPGPDFIDRYHFTLHPDGTAEGWMEYFEGGVPWSAVPPGHRLEVQSESEPDSDAGDY